MYENIRNIKNIEELKNLGSIEEIITTIEELIQPIKIKATSYEELLECIQTLQCKWIDFQEDEFFKSEESKYLFCLTKVDGKKRNQVIGLTDELYDDKDKAKNWYWRIVKIIRPNVNNNDKTKSAFNELKKLYDHIIQSFEEEN